MSGRAGQCSTATISPRRPAITTTAPEPAVDLLPLETVEERLSRALASSVADATELVWIEVKRGRVRSHKRRHDPPLHREQVVFVRTLEGKRRGTFRIPAGEVSELESAIRQSVVSSRTRGQSPPSVVLAPPEPLPKPTPQVYDPEIASLTPGRAYDLLRKGSGPKERAWIDWLEGSVVVANSRGLRRQVRVTAATLEVRCGRRPGTGRALAAARRLADIDRQAVMDRARQRRSDESPSPWPEQSTQIVLSPEATASLVELVNRTAFSSSAYREGTSLLRRHLGDQVFDRNLHLRDDGWEASGLPFPFDLHGSPKRSVELLADGIPRTPAVHPDLAVEMALSPTPHVVAPDDAWATNLFLPPGELSPSALLEAADGGIWLGWLERLECTDPQRLAIRARGRGVRAIRHGALGEVLPDCLWEVSLLEVLAKPVSLGHEPFRFALGSGLLGGVSTPALLLAASGTMEPYPRG